MEERKVYYIDENGQEEFNDELALSKLLEEDVLFCNDIKDADGNWNIILYLNCSDVFAWGCSDAESLGTSDITTLYKLWEQNHSYGPVKFACLKRKQKPQKPVLNALKENGLWDEEMESLNENHYNTMMLREKENL